MKKTMFFSSVLTAITASAQSTDRKFVLKNSSDGLSELTSYLPKKNRNIPLSDAYQAMRTVRDSSAAWKINKEDVGIMGFSAGGHLASSVSTHAEAAVRPDFSILFYPVISMDERISHKGSCVKSKENT